MEGLRWRWRRGSTESRGVVDGRVGGGEEMV